MTELEVDCLARGRGAVKSQAAVEKRAGRWLSGEFPNRRLPTNLVTKRDGLGAGFSQVWVEQHRSLRWVDSNT